MDNAKPFLQFGACVCSLIGLLYTYITGVLVFEWAFYRWIHAAILVAYTLLCFLPFIVFIFPKLKTPGRVVFFVGLTSEIIVVSLFVWNIFEIMHD